MNAPAEHVNSDGTRFSAYLVSISKPYISQTTPKFVRDSKVAQKRGLSLFSGGRQKQEDGKWKVCKNFKAFATVFVLANLF